MRQAVAGDDDAFADLVAERWPFLVRLARSVVGEAEAEDVVQDAAVVAWRRLSSLRKPEAFDAWLRRTVTRLCLRRARWSRWARSRASTLVLETGGAAGGSAGGAVAVAPALDAALDVERALATLAPRQRAVMHLTVVEEMTDSEIASVLGIRAASVRSHRRRARQSLQRQLGKELGQ